MMQPIRSRKIKGVVSQGLVFPITCLEHYSLDYSNATPGDDLTEITKTQKYISIEEMASLENPNNVNTKFPQNVPKTDEPRLQSNRWILDKMNDEYKEIIITQKMDGCSATYSICDGIFSVCSRNMALPCPSGGVDHYWEIAMKNKLHERLDGLKRNIAVQGEIVGPKINGGRTGSKYNQFMVFNIWDIDTQQYLSYDEMLEITNKLQLISVPLIYRGEILPMERLVELADGQQYPNGRQAEGVVVKTLSNQLSFKLISNQYLLRNGL
jgi:RNA ligase (TIGR02306 family)